MKGLLTFIAIGVGWYLALSQPDKQADIATGSVEGTVVLAAQRSQVTMGGGNRYGRPSQRGNSSHPPEDSVLVWISGTENVNAVHPEEPAILDQEDLRFNPSLLPIRQHSTVHIRNSDPVYHNVFSLSSTKKFNVGRRPQGEYMDVNFEKSGIIDVYCDIHSNMHAVIYVMPPRVLTWTKTKGSESFRLNDIPAGSYQLKLYALGYEEKSISIEVTPGETSTIGTITLTS